MRAMGGAMQGLDREAGAFRTESAIGAGRPGSKDPLVPRPFSLLADNAYLLLAVTMVFWAGNAVAGRFAVGEISPLLLTCCRWMFGAALLLLLGWRQLQRDWPTIRRHLPYIIFMGGTGFALFNALLYTALTHTTAINSTIVQAGMPMFIFALNFLFFRTRVRWAQILGYSVTLIGVLVAAARGDFAQLANLDINRGDLIMVLAALVYATYSSVLHAKPPMHWLSFLTMLFVSAAIVSIPLALYEATTPAAVWPTTLTGFGVIFYTAIFPSIIGQALFIRGIELIGGNAAGLFVNLVPIFGAILAVLLLGEAFRMFHAAALALVLGGVLFAQRARVGR
jgi:drug/metabolite transporter (DMT)-like permease